MPNMLMKILPDCKEYEDIATYEVISSQGINMLNGTTSFWAEMIFE